MGEECHAAARPLRVYALFAIVVLASLAASWILSLELLEGTPLHASIAVSTVMAAAFLGLAYRGFSRQVRVLREICRECAEPLVYVPRRYVYACRNRSGGITCYSSANNVLYRVKLDSIADKRPFDPWRTGLDFYCVKPLKGKYRRKGRAQEFRGELLVIDPYGPALVRGVGEAVRLPLD
ncbi:MAG: hypothetical protein F7C34_05685 [Desulfurococcales archaeon]|nr:hypothetical protein [Desulfurococcales archaeon]